MGPLLFSNLRRSVRIYVICGIILAPSSRLWAQQNTADEIARRFERAQSFQQQGELIRAESEFRQALGLALEQLGLIYHSLGDLERAETAYQSVLSAIAASDVAPLGLATVYLRKGEFEKGLAVVQKLLAEKPFHAAARHLLGKLYFSMNRFDAAAFELEEAGRLDPGNLSVAFTLSLAYLKQQQLEKAKKIFDRMLGQLGETARIHILFGGAYRETEFVNQAVDEFRRAIELDPNHPRVHYYLGLAYLSQEGRNKIPEAVAELEAELRRDPNEYFANYLLGLVYLTERELEKALPYLRKAEELKPDNPDPKLYLGQALSLLGRHEEVVPLLLRAVELSKDVSRNQYQVANAHYLLGQAFRHLRKADPARKHLSLASEYKVKSSAMDQERLQLYIHSGDPESREFEEAVTNLRGAVIVAPEPLEKEERERLVKAEKFFVEMAGSAYNQLALLQAGRSNFQRAAEYFERAAYWDPTIADLHYNLGLARFRNQRYAQAIPALSEALSRQPDRTPVRVLLGLSYFYREEYPKAAAVLKPRSDELHSDAQIMAALALSLVYTGKVGEGEKILTELLQRYPDVAQLHVALGQLHAQRKNYEGAVEEFKKALHLNPAQPEAHYYLGMAYLRQGDFEAAVAEFRQEATHNAKHAKARYHLGFCLMALKRPEAGIEWMKEAADLDPTYAEPYYQMGKTRLQQGQIDEAIQNLQHAAELDQSKSYIHYQLSQAYLKAGNREAAEKALAVYRQLKAQERSRP